MPGPIVDLNNPLNWALVYNETKNATQLSNGGYTPIPSFGLPIILSTPLLIVEAANIDAKEWWFLGCRLQQLLQTGVIPGEAVGQYLRIPVNRPKLVQFPPLGSDYTLRIEVPPWFERMKIAIYEYTAPMPDATEQLIDERADQLTLDLARVESKIDNL